MKRAWLFFFAVIWAYLAWVTAEIVRNPYPSYSESYTDEP